jgi:GAF domain-containing protein
VEELKISQHQTKEEIYLQLFPQVEALIQGEDDLVANMANMVAALKETFGWWWVGFYLVKGDQPKELVLGPFQGPVACTRIGYGKGVCGAAWQTGLTQIVPDVNLFPGHIACSSASLSEIVVPCFNANEVIAVLDVDSEKLDQFDAVDAQFLAQLIKLLKF